MSTGTGARDIGQAMVMAAGLGTRLRPHTLTTPKPCLPLAGAPILQWVVDHLAHFGIQRVVVNVHHLPEALRAKLRTLEWHGMSWAESDETVLLLGSAGGLRKALPQFGGKPFFSVNADVVSWIDLDQLAMRHFENDPKTMTLAMVEPSMNSVESYRELRLDAHRRRIVGVGDLARGKPYFSGTAVFEGAAFQNTPLGVPSEFRTSVLEPEVERGQVAAWVQRGIWLDIGTEALWKQSERMLREFGRSPECPEVWKRRLANV